MVISTKARLFLSALPLLALLLAGFFLSGGRSEAHPNQDNAGDGFAVEDDCGFVMGLANQGGGGRFGRGQVLFDGVEDQGCVDENGYFFKDDNYSSQALYRRHTAPDLGQTFDMVFTWSGNPRYHVNVDQTTGQWSGYAYLENMPQGVPENELWVWFDWTCDPDKVGNPEICTQEGYDQYRVRTNLETGVIQGLAWNDRYGWILFDGLRMELAPRQVDVFVDILANDTDLEPSSVTPGTAPLADGYEHWRTRMQLFDRLTGEPMDPRLISEVTMDIVPTNSSFVPLNQIEMTGNGEAIIEEYAHPSIPDCAGYRASACPLVEEDGGLSFNVFISSGAPTGNAQGVTDDPDFSAISYYAARPGCTAFYPDNPWDEDCSETDEPEKDEVFFDRGPENMRYVVAKVNVRFKVSAIPANRDYVFHVGGEEVSSGAGESVAFDYVPAIEKQQLMFRPMVRVNLLGVQLDSHEILTYVPEFDPDNLMDETLYGGWREEGPSEAYKTATGNSVKFGHVLRTRVHATSNEEYETQLEYLYDYSLLLANSADWIAQYLGIDVEEVEQDPQDQYRGLPFYTVDNHYIEEVVTTSSASPLLIPIFYGQIVAEGGTNPNNVLTGPTVEQYVCQLLSPGRFDENHPFGTEACYYVSSLPILDPYADPEPMEALGVVKSAEALTGFFEDNPDLAIFGNSEVNLMRNKMYSQVLRYMLGRSAGPGELEGALEQTTGSQGVELMGGRLMIFEGDVVIDDLTTFIDSTVVAIGGDIYLNSDISGGRLGLIALENPDEIGSESGGNLYIAPDVLEMNANIFLDRSILSYDGVSDMHGGIMEWALCGYVTCREETLRNQLYLNGSLISRNTIGGSDGESPYLLGDGVRDPRHYLAVEHDLNRLRVFRLCYEIEDGQYNYNSKVRCNEGEYLSPFGRENDNFSSFIIEYEPPTGLPIFSSR